MQTAKSLLSRFQCFIVRSPSASGNVVTIWTEIRFPRDGNMKQLWKIKKLHFNKFKNCRSTSDLDRYNQL